MLELYHHGSSVCAAKVRFALAEKGLSYKAHYVDILKGEQFASEFLKLNPKAVVPVLVHNGDVLTESTLICEYIEDAFEEGAKLRPERPVDTHRMRMWTKVVDEQLHNAVGALTFAGCHRHIINRMSAEEKEAFLDATPQDSVRWEWRVEKRQLIELGFAAPGAADKVKMYDSVLAKADAALAERRFLASDQFSLADIGVAPYVNRLAMLGWSFMWTDSRPNLTRWWDEISNRPLFQSVFLDWCPAQLTSDLITFGSSSVPEVRQILAS